ncbi:hypothetical protein BD289DRAFT_483874 [Coniella lustricola]|uniref:C2H2-type domain-containing protein n=1 Tax=Coniella lustricola TaxID=2025994 RepID=A0A2T3A3Z5_9PEZI|nr:hypothetical protein BD289DRAFT_483874 [Coniella lustricola]
MTGASRGSSSLECSSTLKSTNPGVPSSSQWSSPPLCRYRTLQASGGIGSSAYTSDNAPPLSSSDSQLSTPSSSFGAKPASPPTAPQPHSSQFSPYPRSTSYGAVRGHTPHHSHSSVNFSRSVHVSKATAPQKTPKAHRKDQAEAKISTKSLGSDLRPPFQCPFALYGCARDSKCSDYKLSRMRDVKQHLRRFHMQPRFCGMCKQEFTGKYASEELERHRKEMACLWSDADEPAGITESQHKALGKYPANRNDITAQWNHMLKIIFPRGPPTKSSSFFPWESRVSSHMPSFTAATPGNMHHFVGHEDNWNGSLVQAGEPSTMTMDDIDSLVNLLGSDPDQQDFAATCNDDSGIAWPMGESFFL